MIYCFCLIAVSFSAIGQNERTIVSDTSLISNQVDTLKTEIRDSLVSIRDTLSLPIAKDTLDSPIEYNARDSIIYDVVEGKIYLFGEAMVTQENITLTAGRITVNNNDNTIYAEAATDSLGKLIERPVFKEGEEEFRADKMSYNFKTKKGKITEFVTKEGEGFLHSEQVKKNEHDEMYAYKNHYTTCDLEHPHFKIDFKKGKVVPNKVIVTGPANLVIADIPTPLFLPFGIFPISPKQNSGLILPTYGESPGQGFYLRDGGFYFGISDRFDLQITGDIYTSGSWGVNVRSGYKKRYKYTGAIAASFGKLRSGDPITDDFSVSRDFRINWSHNQDPKARPNQSFGASVNIGTTTYSRNFDYENQNQFLSNTLNSSINFSRNFAGTPFRMSLGATHNQNTSNNNVNIALPRLAISMDKQQPFKRKKRVGKEKWYEKINLSYVMDANNSVSVQDSLFFSDEFLKNLKTGVKHTIPVNMTFRLFKFINISPNFTFTERWNFREVEKVWDPTEIYDTTYVDGEIMIDTTFGQLRVDSSYAFLADHSLNGGVSMSTKIFGQVNFKRGPIRAFRHVVTPILSYSLTPKWGDRFYEEVQINENGDTQEYSRVLAPLFGSPSRNFANVLTFSIDNILEMKVRSKKDTITGMKKVKILESFRVGSSVDFAKDEFRLNNINFSGRTKLLERVNLTFGGSFDPYQINSEGERINVLGKPRLLNARVALGTSLSAALLGSNKSTKGTPEERQHILDHPEDYIDFKRPWSLSVNYSLNIRRSFLPGFEVENTLVQTLNTTLDLNITPKWKINISTGFDFEEKELSNTRISVYRDLHCWDMSFQMQPFGGFRYYEFNIKVKSSILSDLKLKRRRDWYDF